MLKWLLPALLLLDLINLNTLFAQCTDGSQPECTCSTTPVLCTIDDLDQFSFSMTPFPHGGDGPSPICPSAVSTVSNNPNWFAFTAWCPSITLNVSVSGCVNIGGGIGVQLAVYDDCTFSNDVACNASLFDCNSNDKLLALSGLTPGNVYYFMVNGCFGSYCDVVIDVIGVCGTQTISPWTMPITGSTETCAGSMESYTVENLPDATTYHWYLDAVLQGSTTTDIDINWTTPGTYQLCVDASNDPCVPETNDPIPLCTTVTVYGADAGTLTTNSNLVCPDGTVNVTVTDYNMGPEYEQFIIITDSNYNILEIITGATGTANTPPLPFCGFFFIYSYNYIPSIGTAPVIGDKINTIDCSVECCDLEMTSITVQDMGPLDFIDIPLPDTFDCFQAVPPIPPGTWVSSCFGSGVYPGDVFLTIDPATLNPCNGGMVTWYWERFNPSSCGWSHQHWIDHIIRPMSPPVFVNPPPDMTVSCSNAPTSLPGLEFTNNVEAGCLTAGTAIPTQTGSYDVCGGMLTYTWEVTDTCNNTITHTQNLTILPAEDPVFQNPPGDITISCGDIPTSPPDLSYTNNETGVCLDAGTVTAVQTGTVDACGGILTNTWEVIGLCGNPVIHVQNITVESPPAPSFENPPGDITISCGGIPSSPPPLNYTNNESGFCLVSGTAIPTQTGSADVCGGSFTYTWELIDQCNNITSHSQNITVLPASIPAFVNPPVDITVDCNNIPISGPDLMYTNNESGDCLFSGSVSPTQSGSADVCGGTITYTWEYTDPCSNTITHAQNITVTPASPVSFVNPPIDITVDCNNIPTSAAGLMYTNNESGDCLFSGSVSPIQSGSADVCGGVIIYTWEYTDLCSNTITHVQNITVTPAPSPTFVNPPNDITVDCNNIPTSPPDLNYTNNGTGNCLISGIVSPTQTGMAGICGGTIINTWAFTDPCGNNISHVQTITVTSLPPPSYINPPANITVDCNNVPASAPNLMFSNNHFGVCLIEGSVSAVMIGNIDLCGGSFSYLWEFTDPCGNPLSYTQTITITPAPPPVFINPPTDMTLSCNDIVTTVTDLAYTNNATGTCLNMGMVAPIQTSNVDVCGGTIVNTWNYTDPCNNTINHVQTITVEPALEAIFIGNLPQDMTLPCSAVPTSLPILSYSNNSVGPCLISGSVSAIQFGGYDECGGSLSNFWEFTDACGRIIQHEQNITIEPTPMADFVNYPLDIVVDCADAPTSIPELAYTNGETGACAISGSVLPTQFGGFDVCGGNITYTWTFVDACSRTIFHTQNIGINPAAEPVFLNLPPNLTVDCDAPIPLPIDLTYTNNIIGLCGLDGTVSASVVNLISTTEYTWTFTNPCTNTDLIHTQIISQNEAPDIIIDLPTVTICEASSFDLSTLMVNDLNGGTPTITYHNASPANPGNELASTIVNPLVSTTFYILGTDDQGCTDETSFEIMIEFNPFAGNDGSGEICESASNSIDLFNYLSGAPLQTGIWFDSGGAGVNLSNPFAINLSGFPSGIYTFDYLISSAGACENDTATVTLELLPEIMISALNIACTANPNFYEVTFSTNGFNVGNSVGTYNDLGGNMASITDIPIDQTLVLTISHPTNASCTETLSITPPDCDCPTINPPTSNGDITICEGATVPPLSFSVGLDETANWYDTPAGGTLLLGNSTTFNSPETTIGIYVYYVESENITSGCFSSLRTPIQLEILANPISNNTQLQECDNDGDGFTEFDLSTAQSSINGSPGINFTFHETLLEAQNESNPLPLNYTNTVTPNQILFVNLSNTNNCSAIAELTLTVLPPPSINLQINSEVCLDDGNGSVTIISPNGIDYSLDNINWISNNFFDNLSVGNYTAYVEDNNGCLNSLAFVIAPGLELLVDAFDLVCDNNGTSSDPADDIYNITFTINNNSGNIGTFTLNDGSSNIGTFNYNESNSISLPAIGQTLNFTFTDDNTNCTISQTLGPLNPCSSDCLLNIDLLDYTCDDNGTNSDPSDDFYFITINASAINGSFTNIYNVLIDGIPSFNFPYNNVSSFTLPANGNSPIISIIDNEDDQCLAIQTIGPLSTCSNTCVINFDLLTFNCNDNGTITNPTDDFYDINVQASAINPGPNNRFEVFVDNISLGIFDYATGGTFSLPANGNVVQIQIQDADEPLCSTEQSIGPLDPCDEDCTINATVSNIICNDNGTNTDPTDDTFSFNLLVNGQNTGTAWQTTDGSINGNYGSLQSFGPFNIADGNLNFDLQDLTTNTCLTSIAVTAPITCSNTCVINFDLLTFNCNDNGTITDPTDDFYDINVQAAAINPGPNNRFEVFVDNISLGIFDYATGGTFSLPANGNVVQIQIQDADETLCSAEQSIGPLDPCNEDCTINATVSNIICNNNGTNTDPTDDTFTFDLLVNGQNTGTAWQATDGSINGNYGSLQSFGPFNIADGNLNFDLQDLITNTCLTSIAVTAPITCSNTCVINFDLLTFNCNDNGTITDPTDDFYDINVQAAAINPGPNNRFEVFVDNISLGIFDYATGGTFSLPANGNVVQIQIQDADETLCSAEQSIGPLDPCNEDCTINPTVSNIICNNNGTNTDPTDDTFTFDLLVNGQNTGTAWQATDGSINGNYGSLQSFGPFNIADGNLNFDLQDLTTNTCLTSIAVTAPITCSNTCVINFDLLTFNCNDNGTITNPTDDFYDIIVQASAINPGPNNRFEVFVDNISLGIFDYATGGTFSLPANGNVVQIQIQDADETLCSAEQSIGPLDPCDEDCTINATVSNIICNNNGTNTDPTDDTFTFNLLVNGQNTGTAWQATDGSINGNYGSLQSFGPFNIANGNLNFDLQDLTTNTCLTSIAVTAPITCSNTCVINFDLLTFNCNDNGTITDPTDDFYDINVQAAAINPGPNNRFEVFVDNISLGIFDYATGGTFSLPANGNVVQIQIQDADETLCSAEQSIGPLDPCNEDCTINATVSNIICNNNGTNTDPTDDTFTFDLLVNGQNTGTAWQATDGSINGNYGSLQSFGPFNIADGNLNFDLQDLITNTCLTSIAVTAPITCSNTCVINFDLLTFNCNDNGTITDPTDDFYDINVQAAAINPGPNNRFEVFVDNISLGIFDYATGGTFSLPANGNVVQIQIQDADETLCSAEQSIGPLDPCNEDCTINATVSNIICNNNGTNTDPTDDTFTFDLLVNGQNTGTAWQATDGSINGNYGSLQSFGPFNIADGNLNFDLQDLITNTCLTSIAVTAPITCSNTCVINFDLLTFNCNDNGTITDPTDDFYDINVQASAINPGPNNRFEVFVDNISLGIFDYATGGNFSLPANGNIVQIQIQDADETLCSAEQSIGPLDPCDEDCTINATVSNIICNDNGTGNDPFDDTFTFDLLVNGQNIATSWQSTDGLLSGPYGNVQNFGPFLINQGNLNFDLQDLITPDCITGVIVDVPSTCSSCPQSIDAGTSNTITCINTTSSLSGSSSEPGIYQWTGPNSFSAQTLNATVSNPGWYFLNVNFPNNCSFVDSVLIEIDNTEPIADAGPDQFITCSITEVELDASNSSLGPNILVEWTTSDGTIISGQNSINTILLGSFSLQITDTITGCTATDQVMVIENTNLPSAVIYADPNNILNCIVTSITLSTDNEVDVVYSWNNGTIAPQIVVGDPGVMTLLALDTITGCDNTNQIIVNDLEDYPLIDINPADALTCDDPQILIDASASQSGTSIIYSWFDAFNNPINGQNGNTLLVNDAGFYYLQLVDTLNGCENTDSVIVVDQIIFPLSQGVEDVNLFCGETQTILQLNIDSTNDLIFNWTTANGDILSGANTTNPLVNAAGNYIVAIQDTTNGCLTTDNTNVFVNTAYPAFSIANVVSETCLDNADGSINITDVSGGTAPYDYFLNNQQVSSTGLFTNLIPGTYSLLITDFNGCQLDTFFTIEEGIDLELNVPEIIELIEGQSEFIQAVVNVPVNELNLIQWNPQGLLSCDTCLATTIQAIDNETFQLTIVHNNGCVANAVINLIVRPKIKVYIPNAFSPNADGINDSFTLYANERIGIIEELSIFDRWGEKVFSRNDFSSNDPNLGWNGRFKGELMNPAVFVYYFKVRMNDGTTEKFSGDVTLMR